jgi:hypothetical protein
MNKKYNHNKETDKKLAKKVFLKNQLKSIGVSMPNLQLDRDTRTTLSKENLIKQ